MQETWTSAALASEGSSPEDCSPAHQSGYGETPEMRLLFKATRGLIELRLLEALVERPNDSQVRIARRTGLSLSVTHHHLHRLQSAGLIAFEGPSDKKLQYIVTQEGFRHLERLESAHLGASLEMAERAGSTIRRALEDVASHGHASVAVIGPPAAQELARSLAPANLQVTEFRAAGPAGGGEAVLVLDDHFKPGVELLIDRAKAGNLPIFKAVHRAG